MASGKLLIQAHSEEKGLVLYSFRLWFQKVKLKMFVYVIDDDEAVGRTIGRSMARAGWSFNVYTSAEAFLDQVDELTFGCVVLDIKMPGMDGLELLDILERKCPEWPVVMMSGHGQIAEAIRSFRKGAIHFLLKPFKKQALLSVLEEAAQIGQQRKAESARERDALLVRRLSKRELEVLRGLADGFPSKAIAWELGISTRTVEMHRSNILSKLGARNTSQAAAIAHRSAVLSPRENVSEGVPIPKDHKALARPSC